MTVAIGAFIFGFSLSLWSSKPHVPRFNMLGFGEEELTVESNAIPCLIFTQLLVLLLLFALLFFFVVFPLDPGDNLVAADTTASSTSSNFFLFDAIQQIELPQAIHDSSPSHSTTTLQHRLLQVTHLFSLTKFKFYILIFAFTPRKKVHAFVFFVLLLISTCLLFLVDCLVKLKTLWNVLELLFFLFFFFFFLFVLWGWFLESCNQGKM